jgi:hypothetical protein
MQRKMHLRQHRATNYCSAEAAGVQGQGPLFPDDAVTVPGPIVGAGLLGLILAGGGLLGWWRRRRKSAWPGNRVGRPSGGDENANGEIVLVTRLCEGQHATVMQLPASPHSVNAEVKLKPAPVVG